MTEDRLADIRGASRLAIDATVGITGLVEAMHAAIARTPVRLGGPVAQAVNGVTWLVYRSVDGVARAVGGGLDVGLAGLVPVTGRGAPSPPREAVVAALNGVLGDHLAASDNPLAIPMRVRRAGTPVVPTRAGLAAAFPRASRKIVVLVHGLCMNDLQWTRREHDHGAGLARDLGYTPVYLHYNTGLHVSTNGRLLAETLDALVAAWPAPLEDLAIVAHSMGGLVARSAHHHGTAVGQGWARRLGKLVFLGTPHHGAPLERGGHRLHRLVESGSYTAPFGLLGRIRSAGITDLRHGSLFDEDWQGRDRFAEGEDVRRPVPLPGGVACFALAGTTGRPADRPARLPGDGLVPVASALGHHRDQRRALDFPASNRWIAAETDHFGLLDRPAVYDRIRAWLAG